MSRMCGKAAAALASTNAAIARGDRRRAKRWRNVALRALARLGREWGYA